LIVGVMKFGAANAVRRDLVIGHRLAPVRLPGIWRTVWSKGIPHKEGAHAPADQLCKSDVKIGGEGKIGHGNDGEMTCVLLPAGLELGWQPAFDWAAAEHLQRDEHLNSTLWLILVDQ
jgi:hypothetical protein